MEANPGELERFGKAIRKIWLYETIMLGAEKIAKGNLSEESTSTSESEIPNTSSQQDVISSSEHVSDSLKFWEVLNFLEVSWVPHSGEDGVQHKLSQYVEKDPSTFEELKKRRLAAKNDVYGYVRQIMYSKGQVRIYRGVRCKPNGVLKVSLFYGPCKWVTSMWVTLVPITLRENGSLEDIEFTFNCSLNLKSSKAISAGM
uniref:Trans-acting factor C n=2 Tax=cellular organisms TaxID=131567 RepID=REP2_LACFM|nr:RecName: Full=Trans-acting factor C; AltName: Full=REP2 [Lachancea fermentati]AAA35278.1 trans-acting factor C [Lachancea fermentati]